MLLACGLRWRCRHGGGRRNGKVEAFEFSIDHLGELLKRLSPVQEAAVDEERWRARDSKGARLGHIVLHTLLQCWIREVLFKLRRIEADLFCILLQVVQRELVLISKQLVMELPEFTLTIRCFSCDRSWPGKLMKIQRVMLPDDAYVVAVSLANLFKGRTDPGAERSLELRELGDRDRRPARTLEGRSLGFHRVDFFRVEPRWARRRRSGFCAGGRDQLRDSVVKLSPLPARLVQVHARNDD
jgi:hypothetical protein